MQCERLLNLAKTWYLHVKEETMAPARMIQFIKNHVATCDICLADPDIQGEIEKITEIILPESKIPKAVRLQQEREEVNNSNNSNNNNPEYEDTNGNPEDEEQDEYMDDDEDLEDEDLTNLD